MTDPSASSPNNTLDTALMPSDRVSRRWIGAFSLAWFGYWMATLLPVNLLLPLQFAELDPANKVRDVAIANAVAGLVALIALPICGALCDRTRTRFGRRRVWMLGGTLVFAASVFAVGLQSDWVAIVVWWGIATVGASAAMGGLTAVVADRVPEEQRGTISSAIYGPQALGVVVGVAIVSTFALTNQLSYLLLALALVACTILFVWKYREVFVDAVAPLNVRAIVASMWVNPRKNPDFAWAFSGRLLVNLGNTLGTCYLLYFLTDALKVDDPEGGLLIASLTYLVAALAATYLLGWLSDKLGKRRVFIAVTACMKAAAGFLLAFFPSFETLIFASALMGGGFGAYMAVDQAVITQVLPDAGSRAKDLGIMNVGSIVPTALAPLLAAVIITHFGGYAVLFGVTGLFTAVGAALVYKIKSVP